MARILLDKQLAEREGRDAQVGFVARVVSANVRGKSKFNILEDGIMSPIIAALAQSVVAVREYVVNRARGSLTERTRCRLLVAPQLEHVWGPYRVD